VHPQAVSTVTAIPHTPHVYLLPFGTTAFFAGLAAGFAAAFTFGAGFLAAGLAVAFAAGLAAAFAFGAGFFAAGFAAGLLFVAIVLPPCLLFYCFNIFILCILNI
jgi:hypothetical protein